jgi:hypothetical protein
MIKFIVAALWLCAVTAGSIFYSYSATGHRAADGEAAQPFFGGLDYVKGDMISVPNIRHGAIQGYFLARLVYTAEPDRLKQLSVPIQSLLLDEVYSYIYSAPPIDPDKPETFDLEALKAGIRDSINKRVGETLIHDVMLEQVEYVPKDEIRNNAVQRRITPSKYLSTSEKTGDH